MLHTGRGPLPVTSASGVVPMKPRMASSKSCRLANGSVFANSALAFNVAGSGPFGAIWPCAAEQPTAIMTAMAAALYVFDMNFSRLGEYDIEIGQRHRTDALAGRGEVGVEHGRRSNGDCRLADAAPEATARHHDRFHLRHLADPHRIIGVEVGLLDAAVLDRAAAIEQSGETKYE